MKLCVLSSGSEGNCTYIETKKYKILIDAGSTLKYITEKLSEINVLLSDINIILITHAHGDHVNSVGKIYRRYNNDIYMTDKIYEEINPKVKKVITKYLNIDEFLPALDIKITPIKTSHDNLDSQGFIVEEDDKSIVYITDTGYINQKYHNILKNKNVYIMESNHDPEKLMEGRKNHHIKNRVVGDVGHLSNQQAAGYLKKFVGKDSKLIILAHLSKDDNDEETALQVLNDEFKKDSIKVENIIIAKQKERTDLIEV